MKRTKQPEHCCGQKPTVFEMRPGDWVVHCEKCFEGTGPCKTRINAVNEWNRMIGKEPK